MGCLSEGWARTEHPSAGLEGVLSYFLPQQKLVTMAMQFTIQGCLAFVAETDQATFIQLF